MAPMLWATSEAPGELMKCRFLGTFLEILGQSEESAFLTDWFPAPTPQLRRRWSLG